MNNLKCNKATTCSFHQQHNCPHGIRHSVIGNCNEQQECAGEGIVTCIEIDSFSLIQEQPIEKIKTKIAQHDIIKSNNLVDFVNQMNELAKEKDSFELLTMIEDTNWLYCGIYGYKITIKK